MCCGRFLHGVLAVCLMGFGGLVWAADGTLLFKNIYNNTHTNISVEGVEILSGARVNVERLFVSPVQICVGDCSATDHKIELVSLNQVCTASLGFHGELWSVNAVNGRFDLCLVKAWGGGGAVRLPEMSLVDNISDRSVVYTAKFVRGPFVSVEAIIF